MMQVVWDPRKIIHHHDLSISSMHLSGQTLRKVTKISTVPDRWSRCLCGLVEVYSPSLSPRSDSPSYHPVSRDQASIPAESSGVAHRDRNYETALTSEPLNLIPADGDWQGAIPSSAVDCTSRITLHANDKTFWEGSAANSPIPDSLSRLHVYNRTRRLPPEVEADPLACFLQNHRVRSTAT